MLTFHRQDLLHLWELDPIRRYLPCYARQKPLGRYSSFLGLAPRKEHRGFKYTNICMTTRPSCSLPLAKVPRAHGPCVR